MRTALLLTVAVAVVLPASVFARPSHTLLQRAPVVIEHWSFHSTKPGLEATIVTGDVLEFPWQTHFWVGYPGFPHYEARLNLLVNGMPSGRKLAVAATRECMSADGGSTASKDFRLTLHSGHPLLLPALVAADHDGVTCSWVLDLTVPGKSVTLTLKAPAVKTSQDWWVYGSSATERYERETCVFTISGSSKTRSCKPLTTGP